MAIAILNAGRTGSLTRLTLPREASRHKNMHVSVFPLPPLQGETARERLDARDITNLGSVVLQVDGKTYRHSSPAVRMLWRLGDLWSAIGAMLWLVPWPIRHFGYKTVAANRYRLLGKRETCRLPMVEERDRFLP